MPQDDERRFIADHMLGSLARWLRFLGCDTLYPNVMADAELLELSRKERRVVLTRDRELALRASKKGGGGLYITKENIDDQLLEVIAEFNLKPQVERLMMRCSLCNTPLRAVKKERVRGKVPEGVYELRDRFWKCEPCKKYYWEGTHFQRIIGKLRNLVKY